MPLDRGHWSHDERHQRHQRHTTSATGATATGATAVEAQRPYWLSMSATASNTPPGGPAGADGDGTAERPWILATPPGGSEYAAWRDETADPPALVAQVGSTQVRYHLSCITDLHQMLLAHGDWVSLGNADEQKDAKPGTVEAWARAAENPVGGWYGLKRGLRGRFANYVPPVLEVLGLAEVEHQPRNNRMRARG